MKLPDARWLGRASAFALLLAAVGCAAAGEQEGPDEDSPAATIAATTGAGGGGTGGSATTSSATTSSAGGGGAGGTEGSGGSAAGGSGGTPTTGPPTPWDASPCVGPAVADTDLLAFFPPASTMTTFGSVWVDARTRNCQDQTGCQAWQTGTSADLYRISWTGNGFAFIDPTTLGVPSDGTITCTVPGPSCTLTIGPMTSNVYPPEQGSPLGITPRVNGAQVQVGNWSANPQGNYLQYDSSVVTSTCLWGTMYGRTYSTGGVYVETQLVVWGSY